MGLPIVAIVGPTASGKTRLSVALCQRIPGEVISMDSMQIYRGMDVGTAKPTQAERGGVAHHMLDVADPGEAYTVSRYREEAARAIEQVASRGCLPVLVGGTGLYLNALTYRMTLGEATGDEAIRERLHAVAAAPGGRARLHAMLTAVDPVSAARLHENDVRRVVRALEVYEVTGKPISQRQDDRVPDERYAPLIYGLEMERERLYARIDARVDEMMAAGLEREVRALTARGLWPEDEGAMQAIGYKEIAFALRGAYGMDEAVRLIKRESRRYAKRQMTWFRADARVRWIRWEDYASAQELEEAFVARVCADLDELKEMQP